MNEAEHAYEQWVDVGDNRYGSVHRAAFLAGYSRAMGWKQENYLEHLETPKCCCGEPWHLGTVHRKDTPCFDYIEHPWVGLTDEEVNDLYNEGMGIHATIEATEEKLKEKNR